ncbi:MAG TPA: hypothetical protein VHL79_06555, partial [Ramlibacter sp.]|nr:hypothetical protein [Ramlibacter sp.]
MIIVGGTVGDRIVGGTETDYISGGGGDDTLTGGGGNDSFLFDGAAAGTLGVDMVTDLRTGDSLVLANVTLGSITSGNGTSVAQGEVEFG